MGAAKANSGLVVTLLRIPYGQGFVPDDGKFKALGIQFNNTGLQVATEENYLSKI